MTLTNRLTRFSMVGLALILASFSTVLYFMGRYHLYHTVEVRLASDLLILAGGAELKPDGVEWEPAEHGLAYRFGRDQTWLITDPQGNLVEFVVPKYAADFLNEAARQFRTPQLVPKTIEGPNGPWMIQQLRLEATNETSNRGPEKHEGNQGERLYPALLFTMASSLEHVRHELWELAVELIVLSAVIWFASFVSSRAVCRWALRPVTRMAAAAQGMDATHLGHRLPLSPTKDELENLGRAFNGLLERVEESFERQKRFTAEASHQLRTPLAAVLGQVEVALRRDRPPEEYRRALESVHGQADRLRRIVDALLFLARADAETRLPGREKTDLGAWLPEHLRAWADHPRWNDIAVIAHPVFAAVHPVLLGELVNVLLDNACKYSPAGTPVSVRAEKVGDRVELSVSDVGSGITVEDSERLFEPFFRSPEARRRGIEGLGLGLAVARRIAAAHGGTLEVESGAGKGCRFVFRIPTA